jgi:hypothetical protein
MTVILNPFGVGQKWSSIGACAALRFVDFRRGFFFEDFAARGFRLAMASLQKCPAISVGFALFGRNHAPGMAAMRSHQRA